MVMRLFIMLLCLGVFAPANAATTFVATTHATKVELGKYFVLHLSANNTLTSLARVDLSELEKYFHVDTTNNIETLTKNGVATQSWQIHLYPYLTGTTRVPALSYNNVRSRPFDIQVTSAIDPRTNQPFTIEHHVSTLSPWQRQQVLVTTTIKTDNKFAQLETKNSEINNMDLLPVTQYKQRLTDSQTRYTVGWAIFPLVPGTQKVSDLVVNYSHQGKITHRFYSPTYRLTINPLPLYVPPTIPVGKLSIHSKDEMPLINTKQSLQYWHISLQGSGLPTHFMPMLEAQIHSSKESVFYPVTPSTQQTVSVSGVTTAIHYRIPYKLLQQGIYTLPTIKLNYFDPDSGKLVDVVYTPQQTLVTTRLILIIAFILLGIFSAYVVFRIFTVIRCYYSYVKNYLRSLTELLTAQSCHEIKCALIKIRPHPSQNKKHNITLQYWQHIWQMVGKETPNFITELTQAVYRGQTTDLVLIRNDILSYVARKWWQRAYLRFVNKQAFNS